MVFHLKLRLSKTGKLVRYFGWSFIDLASNNDRTNQVRRTLQDYLMSNPNSYRGSIVRPPIQANNFENNGTTVTLVTLPAGSGQHVRVLVCHTHEFDIWNLREASPDSTLIGDDAANE
ncbi:hypothetical protein Fmac_005655 [Flemingia macrophylla]|uniref:Uncharacterized protein n=1 Tax=Flemingia macrophylla TaxID=520843 RepID=A0ABD1N8D1_9FABA